MIHLTALEWGDVINRRHPEYSEYVAHWEFLEETYEDDREYYKKNIFRYIKEGNQEFKQRVERATRFNHSKEVVDIVGKYIFKNPIFRNETDAPVQIQEFWKRANKSGNSPISKFIRQIEKQSSIFGRIWIVVDNTRAISSDPREYAYIVKPQNVLDFSYDENGELNWILISETYRYDENPFETNAPEKERFRLWTKNEWYLIEEVNEEKNRFSSQKEGELIAYGEHNLGLVPAFPQDHSESEEDFTSPSLIASIAYLDRSVANYMSNLDAIIQDQTFSQLAMPAQGMLPGDDGYEKLIETGTKRIFTFDGENGGAPFYLSPDPRQVGVILDTISKIINEIYHSVGLAGERTKQDNSIGIDNSSGVAKAMDNERMYSLLTTKAAALKRCEVNMMKLVMLWNGQQVENKDLEYLLAYPETFDSRGIADEFVIASNLIKINAPVEMLKAQYKTIVSKIYPQYTNADRQKMIAEIDKMTEESLLKMQGKMQQVDPASMTPKGNQQGEANTGNDISQKSNTQNA